MTTSFLNNLYLQTVVQWTIVPGTIVERTEVLEREIFEPDFRLVDMLILFSLNQHPEYAYKIESHVSNMSLGRIMLGNSSVYKALKRLMKEGLVVAGEKVGRRQYYDITAEGARQLKRDIQLVRRLTVAYDFGYS